MKFKNNKHLKLFLFILICTIWAGIFFILPDFYDNPANGIGGYLILSAHWGLICIATFTLLYVFSVNKYFFAFLFPLFTLIGSVLSFFRFAFKTSLTPMLIDATFHNDLRTSLDVISLPLIVFVVFNLFVSFFIIRFRFRNIEIGNKLFHFILSFFLLASILTVNSRATNSIVQRFPFSLYYNFNEYFKLQSEFSVLKVNPDSTLFQDNKDTLNVIFVLGESLRADHLSLNGYKRNTNPLLSKRSNLISLPNIYSEYTNTGRSLPHILTRADSVNVNIAFKEVSFIQLFKQCGFKTAWISNQDPSDSYVSFMRECDTLIYCHPEKSVYNYNEWLDEDLIPLTENFLQKSNSKNLIILHTIGSHWYYNNHYSKMFEHFVPVTKSRIIAQCSNQEILNSYDNSVLYTDYFLNKLIQNIENTSSIVIFLADHGETLGEDGQWLHAGTNKASQNPACLIWCSDKYKAKNPTLFAGLSANKNNYYRTDFLYPSILSAGAIPTKLIDNSLNVFNSEKKND